MKGKWNESTKELANIVLPDDCSGKSILDLGCMHGFFLYEAIKKGAKRAVGVDHDVAEMAIAREIQEISEMPVELIHSDIDNYIPEQSFDIVLMLNIEHVLENPQKTITRFLNMSENLIAEYHCEHESVFPRTPDKTCDSPRSFGHRKLAFFERKSINGTSMADN